jgi:disulfide bond formation protein DsbB
MNDNRYASPQVRAPDTADEKRFANLGSLSQREQGWYLLGLVLIVVVLFAAVAFDLASLKPDR